MLKFQRNRWMQSGSEQEPSIEDQFFHLFCAAWNKGILSDKGPYPKFTVLFTVIGVIIATTVVIVLCGYGTNWYLPGFIPTLIGSLCFFSAEIAEIRIPKDHTSNKKIILLVQGIGICVASSGLIIMIMKRIPFNNMIIFLCGWTPVCFFGCFSPIQTKLSESQSTLSQHDNIIMDVVKEYKRRRNRQSIDRQTYSNYAALYREKVKNLNDPIEIVKKKRDLLLQSLWITSVCTVTAIDFLSDVYFGLKIQVLLAKKNVILRVAGAFILLTSVIDLSVFAFVVLKPQKINYQSHVLALFLELFSFAGTAYSFYILLQKDAQEKTEYEQAGVNFAIFSLITTVLATIAHGFYVADFIAQKSAEEQIVSR